MENKYLLQENILEAISKLAANFKKTPKSRLSKSYCEIKIRTLDQYWDSFNNTHLEILQSAKKEQKKKDEYFIEDLFSKCEDEYTFAKCEMLDVLQSFETKKTETPLVTPSPKEVKLPKINIPLFNGNYNDWTTFHDLYTSLIHTNATLSNVQKLHYLKGSVTGEAEQLLKHIQITEKNYDLAWSTLKNRYNNKRIIVNTILNRFFAQKKLFNENSKGIKELLDTTSECINSLKNLNVNIENWDPLVIHLIVQKLDVNSHKYWEEELNDLPIEELPTLTKFLQFLEKRFRVLEMMQINHPISSRQVNTKSFHISSDSNGVVCSYCKGTHYLYKCKDFIALSTEERSAFVKNQRLCFNCLWPGHGVRECRHDTECHRCQRKHHTLLHIANNVNNIANHLLNNNDSSDSINQGAEHNILTHVSTQAQVTLLPTALINVRTGKGLQLVRALIDPCSQESFISEAAIRKLQLKCTSVNGQVTGVGKIATPIKNAAVIEISSRLDNTFCKTITAFVIKHITDIMPAKTINIDKQNWTHLSNLKLADPAFYVPSNIDVLLGVNIYSEIMMTGIIRGEINSPIAQQTHLGWIVSGGISDRSERDIKTFVTRQVNVNLDRTLQRFWEIESMEGTKNPLTPLEMRAEELYSSTVTRDEDGRYTVALPFCTDMPELPKHSKEIAKLRFQGLERRLNKNERLRQEYNNVLREYLKLQHMELVIDDNDNGNAVYLPHHAVVREDKDTTKVRVVFDASCKGSNHRSLNDELLVGPSLQKDLRDIVLKWRVHRVCFIADIVKMYRQIRVRKEDTDFQRILYRFNENEEISTYRLLTVTFGTACAPYLAMKTLKQVALDEAKDGKFALVKDVVLNDFYMDDVLTGCDNEETAIEMHKQLSDLLKLGGFELQKWCSNSKRFMLTIDPNKRTKFNEINLYERSCVDALGIQWKVEEDTLNISQKKFMQLKTNTLTKRVVLSQIASLFDPMGWLAPCIVLSKMFMQKLWLLKIDWDDEIPVDMQEDWKKFCENLPILSEAKIERWIGHSAGNTVELHGFSDASEKAYAAVVYARSIDPKTNLVKTTILMAKTKVAPLKQISLPRLELCAASLLSKLIKHIQGTLDLKNTEVFAWTDSKIVLAWIQGDPNRWTPFVKNRVVEIQNCNLPWYYVKSKDNPADPASRGVFPTQLKNLDLWWKGPNYLKSSEFVVQQPNIPETNLEMKKEIICAISSVTKDINNEILTLISRCSSLNKLLHVIAYCKRWLKVLRKENNIKYFHITCEEREDALTLCLKLSQTVEFPEEIEALKNKKNIKKYSSLLPLNPFLDENDVLRVGGRLKHADMEFVKKHPVIITKNNALLPLLLDEAHKKTLHGGPQLMAAYLRNRFWIIKGGHIIKRFYKKCYICARYNALPGNQIMGNLPDIRVNPSRPFWVSGVDFAGPILCRMSKGRGAKSYKSYICIFICMCTKAIHIELVSDMTSQSFIAAFKRFVARRGHCKEIWSDHGTTFIAANKELLEMWKQGRNELPEELARELDNKGTRWVYIPPGAPNFGGLWEAGVKSIKYHLKRIIGQSTFTFEELYTLLIQIEACLNSRPLTPLGEDLDYLSPGHFLIGEPLISVPERNIDISELTPLRRWQTMQHMVQSFWKKWKSEYLSRLQERTKWKSAQREFSVGELVLLKELNLPPATWRLGRILKRYPGTDGYTRMYDVRTKSGIVQRPVSRLCRLPECC